MGNYLIISDVVRGGDFGSMRKPQRIAGHMMGITKERPTSMPITSKKMRVSSLPTPVSSGFRRLGSEISSSRSLSGPKLWSQQIGLWSMSQLNALNFRVE